MEWKYLFAISAYILTTCDPVFGESGITNVMLADGLTPNEGRVVYDRSEIGQTSACGAGFSSQEASVVCRQLGYKGVNNVFVQSPFGQSTSIDQQLLHCDGDEETLADCTLLLTTFCSDAGGVICYVNGYIGCYLSVLGELQTPCENGVQDLTIPKCVSLCHHTNDIYTYAGLYQGNMCICGSASSTVSHMNKMDDKLCSSPCAGRDIETCGGDTHIALFNITLYLQNTKRTASPPGCSEPIPTQTAGDVTTTVSIQSSSSTPPPPPATPPSTSSPPSSSPSSSPPTSTSVPSTHRTTTEGKLFTTHAGPFASEPNGLTTTVHVSETNNPTQSTRELATTNIYSKCSSGTPTQSENCTCNPKGVQIGLIVVVVALLLYAVYITFLLLQLRRKVPTRTGENEPDPYTNLQPRPQTDRTYQEMALTSTASSKKPGERRLPSSNLFYENQNVAQYANKTKEGADYENVLTPKLIAMNT